MPDRNEITDKMLTAAVRKAVELKLLPAHAGQDDYVENWEKINAILWAALSESEQSRFSAPNPTEPPKPGR